MRSRILVGAVLLVTAALTLWGCSGDPLPTGTPDHAGEPAAAAADKVALPPMPGAASLEFWEAMDAFMAAGREFLPVDPATDTNAQGRTLADYLPAGHPWFDGTERFTYSVTSRFADLYTLEEIFDPEDNFLRLIVRNNGRSGWVGPYSPQGWPNHSGTWGAANARFRQAVKNALQLVRAMHRFRETTTVFYGYSDAAADLNLVYLNDRGRTVSDLYPKGLPITNTFTGRETEPQYGAWAASPGQVGVLAITDALGINDGFSITAMGMDPGQMLEVRYRETVTDYPWGRDAVAGSEPVSPAPLNPDADRRDR